MENLYNKVEYLETQAHNYHNVNDRLASFYWTNFLIKEYEFNSKSRDKYNRHF